MEHESASSASTIIVLRYLRLLKVILDAEDLREASQLIPTPSTFSVHFFETHCSLLQLLSMLC